MSEVMNVGVMNVGQSKTTTDQDHASRITIPIPTITFVKLKLLLS